MRPGSHQLRRYLENVLFNERCVTEALGRFHD
jgi:hypothetical protein